MRDVAKWLDGLGLSEYAVAFAENKIETDLLPSLTSDDLKDIGVVVVGDRRKLLNAISALSEPEPQPIDERPARTGVNTAQAPGLEAERRQLTVMFVDLVDSTGMAQRFDPEEMRDIILAYQNMVAGEVTRFEGHVAKYMGDGVLAYFGWPKAHEDDAERAVRAALAIKNAMAGIITPQNQSLSARIGIATGIVVVGDLIGEGAAQEEAVVGETPNLAARLQGIAEPQQIALSAATRELLGNVFELTDLGTQTLKGIAAPVTAYAVLEESAFESRFAARSAGAVLPLVGREQELALLCERWRQAVSGEGQMALLTGEAGIGKSRINRALMDAIRDENHIRINYQCSPYYSDSPLYPAIQHLNRAAEFSPEDKSKEKLDKLKRLLKQASDDVDEAVVLLADLLTMDVGSRIEELDLSAQQQRARTLQVLIEQLMGLAQRQPVLFVIEDAQWIDPTTLEFVDLILDQIQDAPVFVLITARPSFEHNFGGHAIITRLTLNRLGRKQSAMIVERLTGGKALPGNLLDEITAKTDGVPLFLEELTKSVLESGALQETEDAFVLEGPSAKLAIPSSLHDSLMARLDRLDTAKEVAQMAACIGREFPYRLLAELSPQANDKLNEALERLIAAELVFRRSVPSKATYMFKHALARDVAYQSLLKSRRQQLHGKIAEALERDFPETAEAQPEIVAHHFTEAGLAERAITYWSRAGQYANERSANLEAVAHVTKGLGLIRQLPETQESLRHALDMQLVLGSALMMTRGIVSPETERAYAQARKLAQKVGDTKDQFTALWGHYFVFEIRAQWKDALDNTAELLDLANSQDDPGLLLQAHHATWTANTLHGNLQKGREHTEQGLQIYDQHKHADHKLLYGGHDPGACALSMSGTALNLSGYLDQAIRTAEKSEALAKDIAHPTTEMATFFWSATIRLLQGDAVGAEALANSAVALGIEYKNDAFSKMNSIIKGRALTEQGHGAEGIDQMTRILARARAKRRRAFLQPYYLGLLAGAHALQGHHKEGLQSLAEALEAATYQQEWFWVAELHRLKGEMLLMRSARNKSKAEGEFLKAIEIAGKQHAKLFELRAATSLARLWGENKKRTQARNLLAPVYDWFTEGFDTADLKQAKFLLDELG